MKPRKTVPGSKNIVGLKVLAYRTKHQMKQKDFLARMQTVGWTLGESSLSDLEWQKRAVSDSEVILLARVMGVSPNELLGWRE